MGSSFFLIYLILPLTYQFDYGMIKSMKQEETEMNAAVIQSATITLEYPLGKKEYFVEDVVAMIQFKSANFKIPCTELPDEFWETLVARRLTQKPFVIPVDELFVDACYNYTPEFYLRDVKGVWDCIEELQRDSRLSQYSPGRIEDSFLRFWNSSQEPECAHYSVESAVSTANQMIEEFVADCLRPDMPDFSAPDKFDIQVSKDLNMELRNPPTKWYFPKWIDGGDGTGFNTFAQ